MRKAGAGTERATSRAGHEKSCLKMGDHPPRLNTRDRPIVNQYREGKAKRTREGSEIDPETACIQTVGASCGVTAYLCIMGQRLTFSCELNRIGEA